MATFTTGEVLKEDIVITVGVKTGTHTTFEDVLYTVAAGERVTMRMLDFNLEGKGNAVSFLMDLKVLKSLQPNGGNPTAPENSHIIAHTEADGASLFGEITYYSKYDGGSDSSYRSVDYKDEFYLTTGDQVVLSLNAFTQSAVLDTSIKLSLKKYSLFS